MLTTSRRPFRCWQCANALKTRLPSRGDRSWFRLFANVHHNSNPDTAAQGPATERLGAHGIQAPIRERLRSWEEANKHVRIPPILAAHTREANLANSPIHRPLRDSSFDTGADEITPLIEPVEHDTGLSEILLGSTPTEVRPGALVEYRIGPDPRDSVVGILLAPYEHGFLVYDCDEGFLFKNSSAITFAIRDYVPASRFTRIVKRVLDILASQPYHDKIYKRFSDQSIFPSRPECQVLVDAITRFSNGAQDIFYENADKLTSISLSIADANLPKSYYLDEITALVFEAQHRRQDDTYPPEALYAVHRALRFDDFGASPISTKVANANHYLYTVPSKKDFQDIQHVKSILDEWAQDPNSMPPSLQSFLGRARHRIDISRSRRDWSSSGALGPASDPHIPLKAPSEWKALDEQIFKVIELWAARQKFHYNSPLQCIGPTILRALDRYSDAPELDRRVGWVFLQEVGYILPSDTLSRWRLTWPEIPILRDGTYAEPPMELLQKSLTPDYFSERRKDFSGLSAYCIDDASTTVRDDAISVESASNPGEYWVHTHVADPASRISPDSLAAKHASLRSMSVYTPGNHSPMLPNEFTSQFSLAPNSDCLTFSTLINDAGEVKDIQVSPGRLGSDVIAVTPDALAEVVGERRTDSPVIVFKQGQRPSSLPNLAQPDSIVNGADLTSSQVQDLKLLTRLGRGVQRRLQDAGALPKEVQNALGRHKDGKNFHLSVVYDETISDPWLRDGYIEGYESRSYSAIAVEMMMRLAGETGSRWCAERGLPIPYVRNAIPDNGLKPEEVADILKQKIYPTFLGRQDTGDPAWVRELWANTRQLAGVQTTSPKPGRPILLGHEQYAKLTSPLRRYSDLIAHWQIHAALKYEQKTGKSLVLKDGLRSGLRSAVSIPFSTRRLERKIIPLDQTRAKHVADLNFSWAPVELVNTALLRAWKWGNLDDFNWPKRLLMTIQEHKETSRTLVGALNWYQKQSVMPRTLAMDALDVARDDDGEVPTEEETSAREAKKLDMLDIRKGDVFEVEIEDISPNNHTPIVVKGVKRVKKGAEPVFRLNENDVVIYW